MLYLVYLIAGIFIGIITNTFIFSMYIQSITYGQLIMKEDEDGGDPYLFLDLDKRPETIVDRKYVVFKGPRK